MNNDIDIKALRKRLGLTQVEMSRRFKVDAITISRWERGIQRPCAVHLRRLHRLGKKQEE